MKLKLPKPVQVPGLNGETIDVSAAQVIEHLARTDRSLGQSGDVERVRIAGRILAAVAAGSAEQTGEIAGSDYEALKAALKKPSRGWVVVPVEIKVSAGPDDDAPKRVVRRQLVPSAVDLLPLLEGLLSG